MRYPINLNNPIAKVFHKQLRRDTLDSIFRSECPFCPHGLLLVKRDPKTFNILAFDNCVSCGQTVEYVDVTPNQFDLVYLPDPPMDEQYDKDMAKAVLMHKQSLQKAR